MTDRHNMDSTLRVRHSMRESGEKIQAISRSRATGYFFTIDKMAARLWSSTKQIKACRFSNYSNLEVVAVEQIALFDGFVAVLRCTTTTDDGEHQSTNLLRVWSSTLKIILNYEMGDQKIIEFAVNPTQDAFLVVDASGHGHVLKFIATALHQPEIRSYQRERDNSVPVNLQSGSVLEWSCSVERMVDSAGRESTFECSGAITASFLLSRSIAVLTSSSMNIYHGVGSAGEASSSSSARIEVNHPAVEDEEDRTYPTSLLQGNSYAFKDLWTEPFGSEHPRSSPTCFQIHDDDKFVIGFDDGRIRILLSMDGLRSDRRPVLLFDFQSQNPSGMHSFVSVSSFFVCPWEVKSSDGAFAMELFVLGGSENLSHWRLQLELQKETGFGGNNSPEDKKKSHFFGFSRLLGAYAFSTQAAEKGKADSRPSRVRPRHTLRVFAFEAPSLNSSFAESEPESAGSVGAVMGSLSESLELQFLGSPRTKHVLGTFEGLLIVFDVLEPHRRLIHSNRECVAMAVKADGSGDLITLHLEEVRLFSRLPSLTTRRDLQQQQQQRQTLQQPVNNQSPTDGLRAVESVGGRRKSRAVPTKRGSSAGLDRSGSIGQPTALSVCASFNDVYVGFSSGAVQQFSYTDVVLRPVAMSFDTSSVHTSPVQRLLTVTLPLPNTWGASPTAKTAKVVLVVADTKGILSVWSVGPPHSAPRRRLSDDRNALLWASHAHHAPIIHCSTSPIADAAKAVFAVSACSSGQVKCWLLQPSGKMVLVAFFQSPQGVTMSAFTCVALHACRPLEEAGLSMSLATSSQGLVDQFPSHANPSFATLPEGGEHSSSVSKGLSRPDTLKVTSRPAPIEFLCLCGHSSGVVESWILSTDGPRSMSSSFAQKSSSTSFSGFVWGFGPLPEETQKVSVYPISGFACGAEQARGRPAAILSIFCACSDGSFVTLDVSPESGRFQLDPRCCFLPFASMDLIPPQHPGRLLIVGLHDLVEVRLSGSDEEEERALFAGLESAMHAGPAGAAEGEASHPEPASVAGSMTGSQLSTVGGERDGSAEVMELDSSRWADDEESFPDNASVPSVESQQQKEQQQQQQQQQSIFAGQGFVDMTVAREAMASSNASNRRTMQYSQLRSTKPVIKYNIMGERVKEVPVPLVRVIGDPKGRSMKFAHISPKVASSQRSGIAGTELEGSRGTPLLLRDVGVPASVKRAIMQSVLGVRTLAPIVIPSSAAGWGPHLVYWLDICRTVRIIRTLLDMKATEQQLSSVSLRDILSGADGRDGDDRIDEGGDDGQSRSLAALMVRYFDTLYGAETQVARDRATHFLEAVLQYVRYPVVSSFQSFMFSDEGSTLHDFLPVNTALSLYLQARTFFYAKGLVAPGTYIKRSATDAECQQLSRTQTQRTATFDNADDEYANPRVLVVSRSDALDCIRFVFCTTRRFGPMAYHRIAAVIGALPSADTAIDIDGGAAAGVSMGPSVERIDLEQLLDVMLTEAGSMLRLIAELKVVAFGSAEGKFGVDLFDVSRPVSREAVFGPGPIDPRSALGGRHDGPSLLWWIAQTNRFVQHLIRFDPDRTGRLDVVSFRKAIQHADDERSRPPQATTASSFAIFDRQRRLLDECLRRFRSDTTGSEVSYIDLWAVLLSYLMQAADGDGGESSAMSSHGSLPDMALHAAQVVQRGLEEARVSGLVALLSYMPCKFVDELAAESENSAQEPRISTDDPQDHSSQRGLAPASTATAPSSMARLSTEGRWFTQPVAYVADAPGLLSTTKVIPLPKPLRRTLSGSVSAERFLGVGERKAKAHDRDPSSSVPRIINESSSGGKKTADLHAFALSMDPLGERTDVAETLRKFNSYSRAIELLPIAEVTAGHASLPALPEAPEVPEVEASARADRVEIAAAFDGGPSQDASGPLQTEEQRRIAFAAEIERLRIAQLVRQHDHFNQLQAEQELLRWRRQKRMIAEQLKTMRQKYQPKKRKNLFELGPPPAPPKKLALASLTTSNTAADSAQTATQEKTAVVGDSSHRLDSGKPRPASGVAAVDPSLADALDQRASPETTASPTQERSEMGNGDFDQDQEHRPPSGQADDDASARHELGLLSELVRRNSFRDDGASEDLEPERGSFSGGSPALRSRDGSPSAGQVDGGEEEAMEQTAEGEGVDDQGGRDDEQLHDGNGDEDDNESEHPQERYHYSSSDEEPGPDEKDLTFAERRLLNLKKKLEESKRGYHPRRSDDEMQTGAFFPMLFSHDIVFNPFNSTFGELSLEEDDGAHADDDDAAASVQTETTALYPADERPSSNFDDIRRKVLEKKALISRERLQQLYRMSTPASNEREDLTTIVRNAVVDWGTFMERDKEKRQLQPEQLLQDPELIAEEAAGRPGTRGTEPLYDVSEQKEQAFLRERLERLQNGHRPWSSTPIVPIPLPFGKVSSRTVEIGEHQYYYVHVTIPNSIVTVELSCVHGFADIYVDSSRLPSSLQYSERSAANIQNGRTARITKHVSEPRQLGILVLSQSTGASFSLWAYQTSDSVADVPAVLHASLLTRAFNRLVETSAPDDLAMHLPRLLAQAHEDVGLDSNGRLQPEQPRVPSASTSSPSPPPIGDALAHHNRQPAIASQDDDDGDVNDDSGVAAAEKKGAAADQWGESFAFKKGKRIIKRELNLGGVSGGGGKGRGGVEVDPNSDQELMLPWKGLVLPAIRPGPFPSASSAAFIAFKLPRTKLTSTGKNLR